MGNKIDKAVGRNGEEATSIFDFDVENVDGTSIPLSNYKGKKAYYCVNVATNWGLTKTNYKEMAIVYKRYADLGLEILAFPCNNFGAQEPGTNNEIVANARENLAATFPMLGKLECENGDKTAPIFNFLKGSIDNGILGQALKWNFSKFLCDAEGKPVLRKGPQESPLSFEKEIKDLLIAGGADAAAVNAASEKE